MGSAVGQVLALAVGVAISPIPLIGVILILATPRGRSNGIAFLAGWIAGLAILGTAVLLISGGADASTSGTSGWVNVLKLLLGIGLLVLAARKWRSRTGAGEGAELPGWMRSLDRFTPGRSAGVGAGLAAVNPKNLILVVGAATTIAQTGISAGSQALALLVFIVIASAGVIGMVAVYLLMGERSKPLLDRMRERLAGNNDAIMAVICLLIGAKLIGDAITGFSG